MSCYETIDARFGDLIDPVAFLETIHTGNRWAEGPVYFADLRSLIWSDIPNDRMLRWDQDTGAVSLFRSHVSNPNGNTRDRVGRLVTCMQGERRVVRTEWDGAITVLADSFGGKPLNSPNDVVVKSDGSIWFTDPNYGIISDYVGRKGLQEQTGCHVYRIDPLSGAITVVADDFSMPNGLAFSPDEKCLYISDSGFLTDRSAPHHVRQFDVDGDKLVNSRIFADISPGIPDGFRVDVMGNLWISAWDGVQCHTPEGELIGKIMVPEMVANLAFGGPRNNRLFITATTSVYAVFLNVRGQKYPFGL
ncbi:SMP-30/gluconolactonase/LRE family protein [Mesorhizobium sp.]|jgi:gluconolactonase|uniref:SMP-30/gluconolactonase/LRE family protein n=1 Tax=Mesorhizobium sp. TaxID=1871066 RepID=UPI003567A289